MFIPGYQIQNILKDFTLQLKKIRQGTEPETASPGPTRAPDNLRLAKVVSRVTDNIMDRIAALGQEAQSAADSDRPSPLTGEDVKSQQPVFDYHLMDRKKGKVRKRLVVEDSHSLVERFQNLTAAENQTRPKEK
jgi:hypothetical protein